jgi:NAD(P)-dependent dehydrogenase (short-subunit alcohol dehydrogenase family)
MTCSAWLIQPMSSWAEVDILLCNAASNPYYGPMEGIEDEQFEKILSNNVISNHWLVQMVAPGMRASVPTGSA